MIRVKKLIIVLLLPLFFGCSNNSDWKEYIGDKVSDAVVEQEGVNREDIMIESIRNDGRNTIVLLVADKDIYRVTIDENNYYNIELYKSKK